jgi:hypothetical protein
VFIISQCFISFLCKYWVFTILIMCVNINDNIWFMTLKILLLIMYHWHYLIIYFHCAWASWGTLITIGSNFWLCSVFVFLLFLVALLPFHFHLNIHNFTLLFLIAWMLFDLAFCRICIFSVVNCYKLYNFDVGYYERLTSMTVGQERAALELCLIGPTSVHDRTISSCVGLKVRSRTNSYNLLHFVVAYF